MSHSAILYEVTGKAALQVSHLEILARLYILQYQYADAAAVYETLAVRKQGLGDKAVDLSERVELYRSAVLQVKCLSNTSISCSQDVDEAKS